MNSIFSIARLNVLPVFLFISALTRPTLALQPLATFIEAAQRVSPERVEASARVTQRDAEQDAATWRLLPTLSINGRYTRNQYNLEFQVPGSTEPKPFMPYNQFDATIALSVPLIHIAAWQQKKSSDAWRTHANLAQAAVAQDLTARVTERYFRLLGAVALVQAARHALVTSEENLRIVTDRVQNGAATTFDLELSQADAARARQDVATAELSETIARRLLQSISGVTPDPEVQFVEDDLKPEPDVAHFIHQAQSSPAKKAARAATAASQAQAKIARTAWYPTVTGVAQETLTNATALVGHPSYYQFMVNASWKFDGTILGNDQANRAQARAAQAQEETQSRNVDEAVFQAHAQVHAGIKKAQAARDQDVAAQRAVEIAQMQYQAGVITQTEVLAAQQAAFMAQVGLIQTVTDLAYARSVLRILSSENGNTSVGE